MLGYALSDVAQCDSRAWARSVRNVAITVVACIALVAALVVVICIYHLGQPSSTQPEAATDNVIYDLNSVIEPIWSLAFAEYHGVLVGLYAI